MLYPTDRFLKLACIPLLLSLVLVPAAYLDWGLPALLLQSLGYFFVGLNLALLFLLCLDGLLIPRRKRLSATRACDPIFSINYPHRVTLDIALRPGLINRLRARVFDEADDEMEASEMAHDTTLARGLNRFKYRLRIRQRGRFRLERAYLTCYSPLGLCRRVLKLPCATDIRVYPDLKKVSRYVLLARQSHLGMMGIRRARRGGGDNEFERLREYQRDDEFRHIDWKASARQDRLIVRTYQLNQNQTIIFLLDCGRMMTAEFQGYQLLDVAINSALLLARVALGQGDRVGLLAFAGRVARYVAPAQGIGHHRRLIQASFDLFARHEESNFDLAFTYLNRVNRKRSLVCLITNVIDEMNARMMHSYLGTLSGRHLPMAVLLKQHELTDLLDEPPASRSALFTQAAAADFLLWKEKVIQDLKNRGVLALEAYPEELDTALINQYLMLKARKLL